MVNRFGLHPLNLLNAAGYSNYSTQQPVQLNPNPDKPEITNYKHHLILKLGQINSKFLKC